MIKKCLIVGIILLFIDVIIAPTINFHTVKASIDDDLVEVTTQACGIKGFGNTTVKLTREQYQDLEEYLVEFRARLNKTTTMKETISLFKEVVFVLDDYKVLPEGMSIQQCIDLVTGKYLLRTHIQIPRMLMGEMENYLCLIVGRGNPLDRYFFVDVMWGILWELGNFDIAFILLIPVLLITLIMIPIWLYPLKLNSFLYYGTRQYNMYEGSSYTPAGKWVWTNGMNGIKNWDGPFWGNIKLIEFQTGVGGDIISTYGSLGATNFIGLKIDLLNFYLGAVSWISLSYEYPWST
ncbi:MAG: hypothetical protein MUC80_03025 [Candidatus Thermoplasmatota archaeon]|jgi:hypothetical protein|nr:hypothetical protein [Candidatus Thermoplasmatota archaeon]